MRRRRAHGRHPGVRGFGLLELVVAFAISLLALALALGLLVEAERKASRAAAEARQTPLDLVLRQIRADLRAAGGVAGESDLWSRDALVLVGHPAGALRYELADRDLRRVAGDGPGRTLLPGASLFRWRVLRPRRALVEVEVGRWENERREAVTGPAGLSAGSPRLRIVGVLTAPRGAGGRSW